MKTQLSPLAIIIASSLFTSYQILADEVQSLEVTTVTGYSKNKMDAPASIDVITAQDIEAKAYRDVTDALQAVPGVFVVGGPSSKGGTPEISIRGMHPKYTLILVDGKPQGSRQAYYNGYGRGAESGWLPPLVAIERIEVVKGPMSSLYGSDALGGVVNIITKKIQPEWTGQVDIEGRFQDDDNSGDSNKVNYYVNGPVTNQVDFAFYGNYYQRDEDNIERGFKDQEKLSNTAKVSWLIDDNQDFDVEIGLATQESTTNEEKSGRSGDLENERFHYALSHNINWSGNNTKSFLQSEELENKTQSAKYARRTLNSQTTLPFKQGTVVVGGQYKWQRSENPLRAKNQATLERWDSAIFAEGEWYATEDFSLTGGLRAIYDEEYGTKLTPRLYGVYQINEQINVKGGASTGYRTPDLKQGTDQWVEGGGGRRVDGADIGNSELTPENSITYELSVNWYSDNGMSANLTAYSSIFDDRISKNVICEESAPQAYDCSYLGVDYQKIYKYENINEADLQGIEAAFSYKAEQFSAEINYTYSDSEQKTGRYAGEPLNNYPSHQANLNLSWQPIEQVNLWSKVKYASETNWSGKDGLPAFTMVDVGADYQLTDNVRFYGGIYNAFNKEIDYKNYRRVQDARSFFTGMSFTF